MGFSSFRAWGLLRVLVLALGTATFAAAHDLGKTEVIVAFQPGGRYQIDVRIDPDALLARLDVLAGRAGVGPVAPQERDIRLASIADEILPMVAVRFDGGRVRPRVEYLSGDADPSQGTARGAPIIRLNGETPEGSRTFTWAYDLVYGSYPLKITRGDETMVARWIVGPQESEPIELSGSGRALSSAHVAWQYLGLGFTHILPKGLDHILFVLGIFLLSAKLRPVLLQVTTFTLAHSITLGLTIYGWLSVPSSIVEPLIALSIAYVAFENLMTSDLKPWRIGLVFAFGLLHGMGFAGVLKELGLPRAEFMTALVTFNLGVEAGQLTVIGLAFLGIALWYRHEHWYRRRVVVPASAVIAAVGVYWTIERLVG